MIRLLRVRVDGGRRWFDSRGYASRAWRRAEDVVGGMGGLLPGVVKRRGVDSETVSAINPRIVYCSLSGYGQTGPYASLVGHDLNYISIGGALGINGWPGPH